MICESPLLIPTGSTAANPWRVSRFDPCLRICSSVLPSDRTRSAGPCTAILHRIPGPRPFDSPHSNHPINVETDTLGGDAWGTLGSEFLAGYFSGNDGNAVGHGNGISNTATNGHYVFVFGTDSFTIEVAHAVFYFPFGKAGFGQYKGHPAIVTGTGRFQYASGSIYWEAPFIVWTPDGTNYYGRGNETITGTICGVQ